MSIALTRRTQKVALIAVFTALAVATDYAMLPLTNIKLMDSIVFVSSLAYGLEVGTAVGAFTWLVYGTVNPLGADGGVLLVILIISETVYAVLGSLARRVLEPGASVPKRSLFWGSLGLIGAFLYDLNTIITPTLISGAPLSIAIASLVPAIPFMVAHEVSDFFFFATAAPVIYGTIRRVNRTKVVAIDKPNARPL